MRNVEFLGKMPDPFRKEDGTRMSAEEWFCSKGKILQEIVETEYGGMPPRAEVVRIEPLNDLHRGLNACWYRIHAGSKEKQLTFLLEITIPLNGKKSSDPLLEGECYPVLLTGDGCYSSMEDDVRGEASSRGYVTARFNRLEIANDVKGSRDGGIHDLYPDLEYSDISAWAWGYSVCMDVFEQLPYADETEVGITGHSRGGKTVMLAAAVDERFKYVCPNNSGCHGAVSHRCVVTWTEQENRPSERLVDMFRSFPTWMGPKLEDYVGREQDIPYDMHYFGAMIAPRYYLQCEGQQDYWINPIGAWQNLMAVRACYRYLGCEDHAAGWFRPGAHRHALPDFTVFLDFMDRARQGLPLEDHLNLNPYPSIEANFDW